MFFLTEMAKKARNCTVSEVMHIAQTVVSRHRSGSVLPGTEFPSALPKEQAYDRMSFRPVAHPELFEFCLQFDLYRPPFSV